MYLELHDIRSQNCNEGHIAMDSGNIHLRKGELSWLWGSDKSLKFFSGILSSSTTPVAVKPLREDEVAAPSELREYHTCL